MWVGNIREGDRTWETPNSGKWTRGGGKGGRGGWGWLGDGHRAGALDGMNTGCYMLANWTPIKKYTKKKRIKV